MRENLFKFFIIFTFVCNLIIPAIAKEYSTGIEKDYPKRLLWGDTHLHSNISADAFSMGNPNLTPSDAFRFARGEEVTSELGVKAKLKVPLDFLMVSDHAEYFGIFSRTKKKDPLVLATPLGKRWSQFMEEDNPLLMTEFVNGLMGNADYTFDRDIYIPIWKEVTDNVDRFNNPGVFTAFSGYEYTSMSGGDNLHRVVIFKDDAITVQKITPFSAVDSIDPEDLWSFLADYNESTGGEAISISHNSNISGGMMFPNEKMSGQPIDNSYAEMRNRWEPLVEVTQVKGDSETHPIISPDDQFADYETWEGNIGRSQLDRIMKIKNTGECEGDENYLCYRYKKSEYWRYYGSYVRSALKKGLEFQQKIGSNPYKFGVIGSTDNHTALSAAEEDNFFGKFVDSEPSADRTFNCMGGCDRPSGEDMGPLWPNWQISASGYAAVWARENTREEIFNAFKRKETYATTGPRIAVRFFGGWNFSDEDTYKPNFVEIGYSKGVPMGSDLDKREGKNSPRFLVMVSKDPNGANIERVQIVKGWIDSYRRTQEKVYDIAISEDAGQSTVNIENATYNNSIGKSYFNVFWEDPNFDPRYPSFYYVRVIEIPTPRWTAYDKAFYNVDTPDYVPMIHQERAYTSSIWYNTE